VKKSNFISGLLLGGMFGVILYVITSFKTAPVSPLPQTSNRIMNLNSTTEVFRLNVDNIQYIVIVNRNGGTAIVRHK
jgi:hypothetical protein